MIARIIGLSLVIACSTAYGRAPDDGPENFNEPPTTVSESTASQDQSQQQQQQQSASASNAGNAQRVAINSKQKRQAPGAYAPAVYASHSCALGWSIGASAPGAGISGGKAKADPACERRELARVLTSLNPQLALTVLCADPIVAAVAVEGDCTYVAPPPIIVESDPAPAPDLSRYATKEDLDRAFKKSVSK